MPLPTRGSLPESSDWRLALADHRKPRLRSSVWQLANSVLSYVALWALMIWTYPISYGVTLALAVVAAGLLVRIFIIFHDCGHGSYFRSRRANRVLEFVTGVLTFTPFAQWRQKHALHHASSGDLDRRGTGEIWTLTVREYLEATRWKRLAYRAARNPFVLFCLAPWYLFLVHYRLPSRAAGPRERWGVHATNGALLAVAVVMGLSIGFRAYFLIQLPVMLVATTAGVWLFHVQHQFEGVQWRRRENWDYTEAALRGSSFYKLPPILQWFTGNIGFHHIHHLSPAIPNYNLARCHRENPVFQQVEPVTLLSGMKTFSYCLWDEDQQKLVGFRGLGAVRREMFPPASSALAGPPAKATGHLLGGAPSIACRDRIGQ